MLADQVLQRTLGEHQAALERPPEIAQSRPLASWVPKLPKVGDGAPSDDPGAPSGERMQRIFGWHVDLAVVDVAQHRFEGLPAGYHLPNGDVYLPILGHKGPEHGLKVATDRGSRGLALNRYSQCLSPAQPCSRTPLTWSGQPGWPCGLAEGAHPAAA